MSKMTLPKWKKRLQHRPQLSLQLLAAIFCAIMGNILIVHFAFRPQEDTLLNNNQASPNSEIVSSRVVLANTTSSRRIKRLEALEMEVGSAIQQKVISCRKEYETNKPMTDRRCDAYLYNNETNKKHHLAIYNPLPRDQFLCHGKVILGPKQWRNIDINDMQKCGYNLESHSNSFPYPPTFENRGDFPGILVSKQKQHIMDDTFSSNVTFNNRPCDVQCETSYSGVFSTLHIYGTDAKFTKSMESDVYYPNLRVDKQAWKKNHFYGTTSFESDVPFPYFSLNNTYLGPGLGLQQPQMPYSEVIKGAVFLAKNCNSKSNREKLVKGLQATDLRVDSLSRCLKNGTPPPGVDLKNKRTLLAKYMFYLSFENSISDDYITEKFWEALRSRTIPVYYGAPNIKIRFPIKGAIFVNDFENMTQLSKYLIKVSNDEELYNSYHEWRKQPYPPAFFEQQNRTLTTSKCRICRWGHAFKYGLGWNHNKQTIEPVVLPRETCVDQGLLRSPAAESWLSMVDSWWSSDSSLQTVKVTSLSSNPLDSDCPLSKDSVAKVESGLIRKVWSNDGCTDFYISGKASKPSILRLDFPMKDHGPITAFDPHTVWIQNKVSRISLVVDRYDGAPTMSITAASGRVEIEIEPDALPIRLRIIVENLDLFHDGALNLPTHYGKIMAEDVLNEPEVMILEHPINARGKPVSKG